MAETSKFAGALSRLNRLPSPETNEPEKIEHRHLIAIRVPAGKVGRPAGKRSDPDFERLTVLVRKDTRKAAARRWEDLEPSKDLSDLVQKLLDEWNNRHT